MIEEIVDKEPNPTPQHGTPVVFARRTPEQSDLCKAQFFYLNGMFDFIRMLDAEDYPKAFVDLPSHRLELKQEKLEKDKLVAIFEIRSKDRKLWSNLF